MRLQNNALCLSYLQEDMNHFTREKIIADTNDIKGYFATHKKFYSCKDYARVK